MKKIFLSFALLAGVLGASAQGRSREQASDAILRGGAPTASSNYPGSNNGYGRDGRDGRDDRYDRNDHNDRKDRYERERREREARDRREESIRRINADYDYRIACVRDDRRLKNRERKRQIEVLQRERVQRLREVQTSNNGYRY
ncbi:MAG: hypothetical protein EOO15_11830 [Chitinophagaceae bacterium]|nr:MAG: hypothetical protein EOO15_11830 [Chitinophagaceae bacterium]